MPASYSKTITVLKKLNQKMAHKKQSRKKEKRKLKKEEQNAFFPISLFLSCLFTHMCMMDRNGVSKQQQTNTLFQLTNTITNISQFLLL